MGLRWRAPSRRAFLRTGAALAAGVGVAGCSAGRDAAVITPTAGTAGSRGVYVPPHVHERAVGGTTTSGAYAFGVAFSVPDYYWAVDGTTARQVLPAPGDNIQLMATVWARDTAIVLPHVALRATVEMGGEAVAEPSLVPLLNQRWGLHAVANLEIDRYGDLLVHLDASPASIRLTGGFQEELDEPARTAVPMTFSRTAEQGLETVYARNSGDPGAFRATPAGGIPVGRQPDPSDLPGTVAGRGTSDDASIAVAAVPPDASPLVDGRPYLAVSASTPYNRFSLPTMRVRGRLIRDDESVMAGEFTRTIDPMRGYHYGAAVDRLADGDVLRLSFPTPPQIARYEGYERAFLEMPDIELTL